MHGGARGSGAPNGNRNAYKHRLYTAEALAERRQLRDFLDDANALLEWVEEELAGA